MFKDRKLLIATKHNKESVIAPLFAEAIQISSVVNARFDTDLLGTFSGEIERTLSPLETVKLKCLKALELNSGFDLVIASEGSFGPHPLIPFLPANEEILMFYDKKNNLEICVSSLSMDTNFAHAPIQSEDELIAFAHQIQFPGHGIILKIHHEDDTLILKDFSSLEELIHAFRTHKARAANINAETDMRAMNNPSRMKHIQSTAQKLVDKIRSTCPHCQWPGFSIKEIIAGLPCQLCLKPTRAAIYHKYQCEKCSHEKIIEFPNGLEFEDPGRCDNCNP